MKTKPLRSSTFTYSLRKFSLPVWWLTKLPRPDSTSCTCGLTMPLSCSSSAMMSDVRISKLAGCYQLDDELLSSLTHFRSRRLLEWKDPALSHGSSTTGDERFRLPTSRNTSHLPPALAGILWPGRAQKLLPRGGIRAGAGTSRSCVASGEGMYCG